MLLLGDIWPQFEHGEGTDEPEWVKTEREHFNKHRDKTSDALLDKEITVFILIERKLKK